MRLTAMIDDLTQKNRKLSERCTQVEAQLQCVNGALHQERTAASSRVKALKAEVATVHDSELKLRQELASRPVVKEVHKNQFESRVRSALEIEETNAKLADTEARVATLTAKSEALASECIALESRKSAHLEAHATPAVDPDEVELLVKKAAMAQAELQQLEETRTSIEADIQQYTLQRDARRDEAACAEGLLQKSNAATAAAVADETAVRKQIETVRAELADVTAVAAAPATFYVQGATPPLRLNAIVASSAEKADALGCCLHTGIPFHFALDAPINITASQAVAENEDDPASAMVNAIVSDLQDYFTAAVVNHKMVGASDVSAVGATEPVV